MKQEHPISNAEMGDRYELVADSNGRTITSTVEVTAPLFDEVILHFVETDFAGWEDKSFHLTEDGAIEDPGNMFGEEVGELLEITELGQADN